MTEHQSHETSSRKAKVMIVDDADLMLSAGLAALSPIYEVVCCKSGLDALASLAQHRPDVMLLDIVMPDLDGYETASIIRRNSAFDRMPILMMSSKGSVLDKAKGQLVGFDGNIVKPFQPDELTDAVARALDEGRKGVE